MLNPPSNYFRDVLNAGITPSHQTSSHNIFENVAERAQNRLAARQFEQTQSSGATLPS